MCGRFGLDSQFALTCRKHNGVNVFRSPKARTALLIVGASLDKCLGSTQRLPDCSRLQPWS